jgi:hypothetical protein
MCYSRHDMLKMVREELISRRSLNKQLFASNTHEVVQPCFDGCGTPSAQYASPCAEGLITRVSPQVMGMYYLIAVSLV